MTPGLVRAAVSATILPLKVRVGELDDVVLGMTKDARLVDGISVSRCEGSVMTEGERFMYKVS